MSVFSLTTLLQRIIFGISFFFIPLYGFSQDVSDKGDSQRSTPKTRYETEITTTLGTTKVVEDLSFTVENILEYLLSPDGKVLYVSPDVETNQKGQSLSIHAYSTATGKFLEKIDVEKACHLNKYNDLYKRLCYQKCFPSLELQAGNHTQCIVTGFTGCFVKVCNIDEKIRVTQEDVSPYHSLYGTYRVIQLGPNVFNIDLLNSDREPKNYIFSPDGTKIATFSEKSISLFSIVGRNKKLIKEFLQKDIQTSKNLPYFVDTTFTPDSNYLILISNYNIIYFYNINKRAFDKDLQLNFGKELEDQQVTHLSFCLPSEHDTDLGYIVYGTLEGGKKIFQKDEKVQLKKYVLGRVDFDKRIFTLEAVSESDDGREKFRKYGTARCLLNYRFIGFSDPIFPFVFTALDSTGYNDSLIKFCKIFAPQKPYCLLTPDLLKKISTPRGKHFFEIFDKIGGLSPPDYKLESFSYFVKDQKEYLKLVFLQMRIDAHTLHVLVAKMPLDFKQLKETKVEETKHEKKSK